MYVFRGDLYLDTEKTFYGPKERRMLLLGALRYSKIILGHTVIFFNILFNYIPNPFVFPPYISVITLRDLFLSFFLRFFPNCIFSPISHSPKTTVFCSISTSVTNRTILWFIRQYLIINFSYPLTLLWQRNQQSTLKQTQIMSAIRIRILKIWHSRVLKFAKYVKCFVHVIFLHQFLLTDMIIH